MLGSDDGGRSGHMEIRPSIHFMSSVHFAYAIVTIFLLNGRNKNAYNKRSDDGSQSAAGWAAAHQLHSA